MELWDVYDENRAATGKTHVRGVPLGTGEYHLVADVWLVNENQEILLTRRHPDKPMALCGNAPEALFLLEKQLSRELCGSFQKRLGFGRKKSGSF